MSSTALSRRTKRGRGMHPKPPAVQQKSGLKRSTLPEFLDPDEVQAVLAAAQPPQAKLLILLQWRAGLRVSEALQVTAADLRLDDENPTIRVRRGKGGKGRVVPVHPELHAALKTIMAFGNVGGEQLINAGRTTAWRWVKRAAKKAEDLGGLPPGRQVGTHTFRHSYARHLLRHGIPINAISRWLGHSSINKTLVYLELLPDPTGSLAEVP